MDLKMARQLYEQAGGMISMASTIGRDLDITTLEDAALGDAEATKRITRINAELASMQGLSLGAAQKDGNISWTNRRLVYNRFSVAWSA